MRFAKTIAFHLSAIVVSTILAAVLLLGCLKLFDNYLLSHRHPNVPDDDAEQPTMRTLDYYPFTGGHIQPYKSEQGKLDWSDYYRDFDVVSGEYGFFIDFQLESPPPKQDNEIRIVLTGGSAAQGWGGRTNADMFYRLLPIQLDQRLKERGQNCKVTVINLAMASSHIYQNFIALNKWAHPLHPDAILLFSGHNEIAVPYESKSDAPQRAAIAGGFIDMIRYSASPPWLKWIARYFPGIVRRTVLGQTIRLMYINDYIDEWQANYVLSGMDPSFRPLPREQLLQRYKAAVTSLTLSSVVENISIPLYEHSLESISRDFPDIPVFAAFQPLHNSWQDVYARMRAVIPEKVRNEDHYDNVQFVDLQRTWAQNEFFPGSFVDSVHLSNSGHILVAKYLSDDLFPFVQQRCDKLTAAEPQPAR